mmetsp:Transcript_6238/g.9866  ORF Transcript_6238/g.9866 Transcript_6238/m.9866 type:complete len:194 (+) Transcript_6238:248-829(+)|eukprot:CAMPEP_0203745844 /NCGR_PEP_ID=MMETSP0098-20131031/1465_1 /ASSEMBLY_ACC=CAM_ASM_000208 /TAXON_ID=96639 /ORGANISM=" , Strain NY0313808BC1" /LENGTH=193 /DNA_ID=CAMNT_0050633751 /DNA_START=239 /DNA_END=820 /DNA_ORIENTATION=-
MLLTRKSLPFGSKLPNEPNRKRRLLIASKPRKKRMVLSKERQADLQKKILKLTGASVLALETYNSMMKARACPICESSVDKETLSNLEGEVLTRTKECEELSDMLARKGGSPNNILWSDEWCISELKLGRIRALKDKKILSLRSGRCHVCGGKPGNFGSFLSNLDQKICRLYHERHTHDGSSFLKDNNVIMRM